MSNVLPSGTPIEMTQTPGSNRGLVVIPDIWGLRPLFGDMCATLADRTGWSVVSFEPFPGQVLPGADDPDAMTARATALASLDDAAVLADAAAAADLVGERVGLIGFCMGGMYAFKCASTGRFDRVVSFYGMAHVPPAWQSEKQGDPVDLLAGRGDVGVMAIAGSLDPYLQPQALSDLEEVGVEVVRYEGADHGFVHDPSRPAHRADDAADAWDRALKFLSV